MSSSRYLTFAASSVLVATASLAFGAPAIQPASRVAPTFTDVQAERGGALYDQRCGQCHGSALDDGSFGPPLTGGQFAQKWQDRSVAEMFTVIRTQMPTEAPGSLSDTATADVLAFIFKHNGLVPSSTALPADTARLESMFAAKPQ